MSAGARDRSASLPVRIVVAEDNASDRLILQEAFDEIDVRVELRFVDDGEDLLDYLQNRNRHAGERSPRPTLVLMDLNLPRMNGHDALKALRADEALRFLPVIVLSTSDSPKQIAQAYDSGANAFIVKPSPFEDIVQMLRRFCAFWLACATLPGPRPSS